MIWGGENAEFITIKATLGTKQIRIILAYGPQEGSSVQDTDDFFTQISIQVNRAILSGNSVMLVGDFNAKLGKGLIQGDVHDISANGKKFLSVLECFDMVAINSLNLCNGVFTRVNNNNPDEKSVLDYVCVTKDIIDLLLSMYVDEKKMYTPWRKLKRGKKYTDHNAILLTMKLDTFLHKGGNQNRKTVWNFRDPQGWDKFYQLTQNDDQLLNVWKENDSFESCYQKWHKRLNLLMHKCFKKKRIVMSKSLYNKEIRDLIQKRKMFKHQHKGSKSLTKKLRKLDKKVDKKIANFNNKILTKRIGTGPISKQDFWKVKKILAPKSVSIPHCILDGMGNEITDPENIRNQFQTEFLYRLRQREPKEHIKYHETLQNDLCMLRIENCRKVESNDFSESELESVIRSLKNGKSRDTVGFIREIFKQGGRFLLLSVLEMMNCIKRLKVFPMDWKKMSIQTILKKQNGSMKTLNNYRGIFVVPILSLIFEKLLKNRVTPHLEQNMTPFQTGGVKGKGITDNLFILRGLIDHSKYLQKEIWITFYDIEKCFDSLWLEDCINSLYENGVKNDMLDLIYKMNHKAEIVVRTPFGDCNPIFVENIVRQGTVLGPVLNNCSLDKVCHENESYQSGTVNIKSLEFVDDIADPNDGLFQARKSNSIIVSVQEQKKLTFAADKCKLLKIGCAQYMGDSLYLNQHKMDIVESFKYLGDEFTSKGDYSVLCNNRAERAVGTTTELISLCKEVKFGKKQLSNMILLYFSVFLPRLIYSSETWSYLTKKDLLTLQNAQLSFLRRVLEVPKSTPVAALYLELGVLSIQFEIEKKQLMFLKHLLEKNESDPALKLYQQMVKYQYEMNWANFVLNLRCKYNLPLNDQNIKVMSKDQWRSFVNEKIRSYAFDTLVIQCQLNSKTNHLNYKKFCQQLYITECDPQIARVIFKARTRMFDVKANFKTKYQGILYCPFCKIDEESLEHIFACPDGLICKFGDNVPGHLDNLISLKEIGSLQRLGWYLLKYDKYRELIL